MDTNGGKSNWLVETYNCKVVILVYCGIFTVVVYTSEREKNRWWQATDDPGQLQTQNIAITLNVPDWTEPLGQEQYSNFNNFPSGELNGA